MAKIDKDTLTAQTQTQELRVRLIKIVQRLIIKCPECQVQNRASKWTFLQSKYFHTPSSWQSGGFWLEREWYCCDAICPSCNKEIYIYTCRPLLILVNHIKNRRLQPKDIFAQVELGDIEGNARVLQAVQSGRLSVKV